MFFRCFWGQNWLLLSTVLVASASLWNAAVPPAQPLRLPCCCQGRGQRAQAFLGLWQVVELAGEGGKYELKENFQRA